METLRESRPYGHATATAPRVCTLVPNGPFINPRRACAARVTVLGLCVCLSVCLLVYDYSRTTGYEAAYERYQPLQCYKGMKCTLKVHNPRVIILRAMERTEFLSV